MKGVILMRFRDSYDTRDLHNMTEDAVFDAIPAAMSDHPEMCKCQDCVLDVAAIALNNLPPHYCVGKFSSMPTGVVGLRHYVPEREKEITDRARTAVEEAINKVKDHPSH
jgi:competence protein ComFB